MHHQETADGGHADEVDVTRGVVAAEQRRQPLQLHRLPYRQARQHDDDTDDDDAGIEQLLHVIVFAQILVRQFAGKRRLGIGDHAARGDRQQLLAEAAGGNSKRQIDQAVDHQQPHRGKMPEQRAAEPAAQREAAGEAEIEQRRGVVDLPSRHDHQDHRNGVGPVQGPYPGRLNDFRRGGRGVLVADN